MNRIPFAKRLKNAFIDIEKEYKRLYELFYQREHVCAISGYIFTLKDICEERFLDMSETFRDTCISLKDFNKQHGFKFPAKPQKTDTNLLVSFGEYSYNLLLNCMYSGIDDCFNSEVREAENEYLRHIDILVEKIGYMLCEKEGVFEIVPKDQAAISVSEIVDDDLSYRVIEYNHQSMRGDIEGKKAILLKLAEKLEPLRKQLEECDQKFENDLFYLLNYLNIRHNNIVKGSSKYEPYVAEMDKDTLEKWYDETYQMSLLAFLRLDHVDRKKHVDELKKAMEEKKRNSKM